MDIMSSITSNVSLMTVLKDFIYFFPLSYYLNTKIFIRGKIRKQLQGTSTTVPDNMLVNMICSIICGIVIGVVKYFGPLDYLF